MSSRIEGWRMNPFWVEILQHKSTNSLNRLANDRLGAQTSRHGGQSVGQVALAALSKENGVISAQQSSRSRTNREHKLVNGSDRLLAKFHGEKRPPRAGKF
jgi:hypothetical protein